MWYDGRGVCSPEKQEFPLFMKEKPMSKFGLYNKIPTQPGKRDALVDILLEVAALMQQVSGCDLYGIE